MAPQRLVEVAATTSWKPAAPRGVLGPPRRLLKSRLLDAISEAVALTVDLFDDRSPRRKLSARRCRHKTFAERSAWRF